MLLRINDKTTQTLAYPGLVLRYVTADLIKKVLAPALDLPPMDDTQARDALRALAGYDWLAYRGPNDEVWHRSDLRRSVLQAMIAQEPAKAARIHEEAVKHFASASTPRERAEGTYHRLMQMKTPADGEAFELKDLQEAHEFIGADAVDLPPAAAALLRFGSGQELSVSDVGLLPSRHLPRAYSDKGKHLVDEREFGRALRLYLDVHATGLLTGIPIDAWETETLFATASWRAPIPDPKPPLPPLRSAVFPDALIDPNRVQTFNVDTQLRSESGVRSLLRDSNAPTIVERLAMGLVLLNAHRPLSGDQKEPLRLLLKLARSEMKTIPPALERRLLFLDVVAGEDGWPQRSLRVTPITIVVNRDSLDALDAAAAREAGSDSDALRALVLKVRDAQAQSVSGRWTVRSMLGTINGLATHITTGDPRVRLANLDRGRMLQLLSAPVPEFRDPCRFGLLEAFTDADGYRLLGGIVASIVGLKLDDLEPDAFVAAVSADPEHTLETYVEAVDRAAALGDLLAQARTARPEAQKLVDVEAAYRRWTGAVEQLFMERA